MVFRNSVIGGITLVRTAMQSANFSNDPVAGITGWYLGRNGDAYIRSLTVGNDNYFIDVNGNAAFNDVTVNGNLNISGQDFTTDILPSFPKGIVFWASRTSASTTANNTEVAVLTLGTVLTDQRMYRIATSEMRVSGTVVGDSCAIRIRENGASAPTTSSNTLASAATTINAVSTPLSSSVRMNMVISCNSNASAAIDNLLPGTHNMMLSILRGNGTGVVNLDTGTNTVNPIQLYVEDLGPLIPDTGVDQSGSGGGTPVQSYTTTYNANWSATYKSDNSRRSDAVDGMKQYQGFYSSNNGNQKALIGFPYSTIQSDLTGATVTKCEVFLYFNHWYQNSGGTAVIGTHSNTTTTSNGPSTYPTGDVNTNRKQVSGWGINVGKWVSLGTTIGTEFKTGTSLGIAMGPGPSNSNLYYGSYDGDNMTHEPMLRITYTK